MVKIIDDLDEEFRSIIWELAVVIPSVPLRKGTTVI
jgi:hypothetical protein